MSEAERHKEHKGFVWTLGGLVVSSPEMNFPLPQLEEKYEQLHDA